MKILGALFLALPFIMIYAVVIRMKGFKEATIAMLVTIGIVVAVIACFVIGTHLLG